LATVLEKQGDKNGAIDALKQGRSILAALVKLSPDNAAWKRDLEEFERRIAQLTP
jgi:hypothetical protein